MHLPLHFFWIYIGVLAFEIYPFTILSLPISGMTMDQMTEERYYLFLRGFSNDDYNPSSAGKLERVYASMHGASQKKKNRDADKMPFSERAFCSAMNIPVYSVGMPKEWKAQKEV